MISISDRVDDLNVLLAIFPKEYRDVIYAIPDYETMIEIVVDLGGVPEIRFTTRVQKLTELGEASLDQIESITEKVGHFTADNRAGIERTLHRISAIRNREGKIIGLTCRIGRAVEGTITIIKDLIEKKQNILFLGPPGCGKTTKLRETARVLADSAEKRVIIVDTSNEIAGDGDIPHPGIGSARRMQVPSPDKQHAVMIEAVENHMPETIIVDEIGTEEEAAASRTIAERGVQLIATAHGLSIENLLKNPTLSDLLGGIQSVILGDEEAKFRGTQKTVLERKTYPTFDVLIEVQQRDVFHVYHRVDHAVDSYLRGYPIEPEIRRFDKQGEIKIENKQEVEEAELELNQGIGADYDQLSIFPFGINTMQFQRVILSLRLPVEVVSSIHDADLILTTKSQMKSKTKLQQMMQGQKVPIHVLKQNTQIEFKKFLRQHFHLSDTMDEQEEEALNDIKLICERVLSEAKVMEAAPCPSSLRKMQHHYAETKSLNSLSTGEEPNRRVRVYPRQ